MREGPLRGLGISHAAYMDRITCLNCIKWSQIRQLHAIAVMKWDVINVESRLINCNCSDEMGSITVSDHLDIGLSTRGGTIKDRNWYNHDS